MTRFVQSLPTLASSDMRSPSDRRCLRITHRGLHRMQDVFGGQRGPVADALNLNAGVALAAAKVCVVNVHCSRLAGDNLLSQTLRSR